MRESCREARNRITNMIDNRLHICTGLLLVLSPIRQCLMYVKNRFVAAKAELIEQWNGQSKRSLYRFLMIAPHRYNIVSLIQQRLRQLALFVAGRVGTTLQESGPHDGIDRLRRSFDPGRTDAIHTLLTKIPFECILRCQAPKDIACADEEN